MLTLLLRDLLRDVEVQSSNDQVGHDVQGAHAEKDIRIIKGNLLGNLHHHKDDTKVGTAMQENIMSVAISQKAQKPHNSPPREVSKFSRNVHLRADHFGDLRQVRELVMRRSRSGEASMFREDEVLNVMLSKE